MPVSPQDRIFIAIGDIHGHCERLIALHENVLDIAAQVRGHTAVTLVHLGDYVDRGPDSAGVISALIELEAQTKSWDEFEIVSLKGNHEQMMIDALEQGGDAMEHWCVNGGFATQDSYGPYEEEEMKSHLEWMKRRPLIHHATEAGLIFVHAGVHPADFPGENEQVYMWTRSPRFFDTAWWSSAALDGQRVIHGHTPTETNAPEVSPDGRRINIDTGACYGGPLTAVILAPGMAPRFLYA